MSRQDRHEHDRALVLAASAIDYGLTAAQATALDAHLVTCPACARSAAAMRRDAIALRPQATPLPSRRVDDAVFAAIAGRRATSPSLLVLVAAALLVVALLGVAAAAGSLLLRTWWTPPTVEVAPPSLVVAEVGPSTTPAATEAPPSPAATASASPSPSPSPVPSPLAGARWSRVPDQAAFEDAGMTAVAASPDRYVAVGWTGKWGANGVAWTSADGRSWQRMSIPSAELATPRGIIHDRLGFVAWGFETSESTSRAAIWTSPDGVTWQRASDIPSFAFADITGIARLGEQLVAVGQGSNNSEGPTFLAWTSDDGQAWTRVSGTEAFSATPNALAATETALVAPAGDGAVFRSADGLQWEVVTSPALQGFMEHVVGSGGSFVGVGTGPSTEEAGSLSPATAWTSTDGWTWLQSALEPTALGWMGPVAAHGSEFVALGEGFGPTFAYRSTDGLTWVEMSTAPDTTLEGRLAGACTGGPCSYRTTVSGLADGPLGPIAVGRTELKSGGYRAVVWTLR
jgi:hypothetical protein